MRVFPFVDVLTENNWINIKRTSQLFVISLIAYYYEVQRYRGKPIDDKTTAEKATYDITISDYDIVKKFKFSINTVINIKRDLKNAPEISIEKGDFVSEKKKYNKFKYSEWGDKYLDFENIYRFEYSTENRNTIYIPVSVIYTHSLSYGEKMSIIWNISLQKRLNRIPKLVEIERASGITTRTIRKAKAKRPELFKMRYH